MKNENPLVGFVRALTKCTPFLYAQLAHIYHNLIYYKQVRHMRRKYPDTRCIQYNEITLKGIKNRGFYSQFGQDYFLCDQGLITPSNRKETGVFVDVGCNDPIVSSNSYYFEKNYGFKGIAIDPLNDLEDKWIKVRPNTIFVNAFVSNSNEEIDFIEVTGDRGWESKLSGSADRVVLKGKNVRTKSRKIQSLKLQDILKQNSFDFDIDLLSVDVEGYEYEVLESVDWAEQKPNAIIIENTGSHADQDRLRSYIINKGYKFYARISIADDVFIKM